MGERRQQPKVRVGRRAALLLLAAAGCTSDGRSRDYRDDPLLNIGSRSGSQPSATATSNPNGSATGPAPPAYQPRPPVTAMPTSNATLAGGGFQPLSGSNDLRIGNGQPQQPAFTDPRTMPPAGATGPVPAGGPVPIPPPGAGGAVVPVSATYGGALDQAYAAAAARNPLYTKLLFNSQTREYEFTLSVPSKLNASINRTGEGKAPTPAEAIRRALAQLDEES
jgi:hypothetical protein